MHAKHRRRPPLHALGNLALTAGAGLGVCCLVFLLAGVSFGVRPLILRSGSMAPTIPAGSLALTRAAPAADLRVGDIVSVPAGTHRVTHRITRITRHPATATLQLRGDANHRADPDRHRVRAADRVWFAVPELGAGIAWLTHPPGVFLLGGYAAILLFLIFRRADGEAPATVPRAPDGSAFRRHAIPGRGRRSSGPARRESRSSTDVGSPPSRAGRTLSALRPRLVRIPIVTLVLGGTIALAALPGWAYYTDAVSVSGSTISAYTVPTTSFRCGALGVASVTFTWTKVADATSYTVHYGRDGGKTATVNASQNKYTTVSLISGGTAWVTVNQKIGQTTWTSKKSNTRSYTVAVVSLCG